MRPDLPFSICILGGTGKEGFGLALRWAHVGYSIIIGSRSRQRAEQAAQAIRAQLPKARVAGMDNAEAARSAEVAVLTVPPEAQQSTLALLGDALSGKILVDATARVDARNPRPPDGRAAAREAQAMLGPGVRVVAAFQNVPAFVLGKLEREISSDVLVCGDDDQAKAVVIGLAEAAGMNAYDAGPLDNAVVVEGLTALIIALNKRYKSKSGGIRVSGITR